MSYLRNRIVNLLNLHYGIHSFAMNGGGVFFAVFLLRAGVPIPAVLGSLALIVALRFVQRPLVLVLGKRWGLKPLVIAGTMVGALQYPVLAEVSGVSFSLLALCIVGAVGDTWYWTCYHAYFASLGNVEHRGHQISAREAMASVTAVAGPLTVGWMLVTFGPRVAFGTTACVQMLSAVPFFGTPNVEIADEASGAFRAAVSGVLIFVTDGWIAASYLFVWQMALFLTLGESFTGFGAAMALAGLVGAIGGLLLGRHIDAGHGHHATWLALTTLSATIMFRSLSTHDATLAVIANACGALVGSLYLPTTMTAVYNQAKDSPCTLRFHIATEGGWDLGCAAGCLTAALLSAFGVSLSIGVLLSLAGVVPLWVLLRRHYLPSGQVNGTTGYSDKVTDGYDDTTKGVVMASTNARSEALAARLEAGAAALATLASGLSDTEWNTRLPKDGRKIGVVVHHVASVYPIEVQLAQVLASGKPITDVTWDAIHTMNANHAKENDATGKEATVALLKQNSAAAAAAIRALSDEELDRAAPISLNSDAPLTCQFMLEDHAVRHSYHHLARIKAALVAAV